VIREGLSNLSQHSMAAAKALADATLAKELQPLQEMAFRSVQVIPLVQDLGYLEPHKPCDRRRPPIDNR